MQWQVVKSSATPIVYESRFRFDTKASGYLADERGHRGSSFAEALVKTPHDAVSIDR